MCCLLCGVRCSLFVYCFRYVIVCCLLFVDGLCKTCVCVLVCLLIVGCCVTFVVCGLFRDCCVLFVCYCGLFVVCVCVGYVLLFLV